jgi:hypothetical protein
LAEAIHDAVAFLLNHLPANLHLVIATRADPPLPIARLRIPFGAKRRLRLQVLIAPLYSLSAHVGSWVKCGILTANPCRRVTHDAVSRC